MLEIFIASLVVGLCVFLLTIGSKTSQNDTTNRTVEHVVNLVKLGAIKMEMRRDAKTILLSNSDGMMYVCEDGVSGELAKRIFLGKDSDRGGLYNALKKLSEENKTDKDYISTLYDKYISGDYTPIKIQESDSEKFFIEQQQLKEMTKEQVFNSHWDKLIRDVESGGALVVREYVPKEDGLRELVKVVYPGNPPLTFKKFQNGWLWHRYDLYFLRKVNREFEIAIKNYLSQNRLYYEVSNNLMAPILVRIGNEQEATEQLKRIKLG